MILETDRLYLREMNQADYGALCKILQDEEIMYAYEGAAETGKDGRKNGNTGFFVQRR